MILCAMENAEDTDGVALDSEKQFVGKTPGQRTAESAVVKWEMFRVGFEPNQALRDCDKEFITNPAHRVSCQSRA